MNNNIYTCIDLKSFYASVECVERNLNPLTTNLVVADSSRTEKTICLAVSPSLKKYGLKGRCRLFEVIQKVKEVNADRKKANNYNKFTSKSYDDNKLMSNKSCELDFIIATPQMARYIEISSKIYEIYLKYISPEDIHVYSIDEVFINLKPYLNTYKLSANDLVVKMIHEIFNETGITATAGIGENLYLAKVAMDIVAKHMPADEKGVRIASLNEYEYREKLWSHEPLTDFWRVGAGYLSRLHALGLYTMGDIARCSIAPSTQYLNEDLLYKEFGINAELLIDHAWGYEPTTIKDIKNYKPMEKSVSSGQVLSCPYTYEKALLVVKEMADALSLDLVEKKLCCNQIVLNVGYDIKNQSTDKELVSDRYGRVMPKGSHGSITLAQYTSSTSLITKAVSDLFSQIVDKKMYIRRLGIAATHVLSEDDVKKQIVYEQLDIFSDLNDSNDKKEILDEKLLKERKVQETIVKIKKKYGKNSALKAMDLKDGATMIDRNSQIGGHKT